MGVGALLKPIPTLALMKQLIKQLIKQPNSDYDDKTVISSLVNSG